MVQEQQKNYALGLKISWSVVITFSLTGLSYYVKESYVKYNINPEILVNERYVQRNGIPFPAMTLCPPTVARVDMINMENFKQKLAENIPPSIEEQATVAAISQACFGFYKHLEKGQDYHENVMAELKKAGLGINETFSKCIQRIDKNRPCETCFIRSLTNYGYCFTFNMLDHSLIFTDDISSDFDCYKNPNWTEADKLNVKWTLEKGYSTKEKNVKPLKSAEVEQFKVNAAINKSEILNFCPGHQGSFRVYLHLPNEIPSDMHVRSYFGFNQSKKMKITASVKKVDESLKSFPLALRKCYFEDERKLKLFKIYTISNCVHECVSNFTKEKCGCVYFGSPRTNNTKVCKINAFSCINDVHWEWPDSYYKDTKNVENFPEYPCNCMPTCTEIDYKYIEEDVLQWDQLNTETMLKGSLQIRFSYRNVIETTNYVTYQLQNFVCDVGGLAGLFLGFSLLTVFQGVLIILRFVRKTSLFLFNKFRAVFRRLRRAYRSKRHQAAIRQGRPRAAYGQRIIFIVPFDQNPV